VKNVVIYGGFMSIKNEDYMSYEEFLIKLKEGIVTRGGNCPVTPLLVMMQGRWKSQIIYELCIYDSVRFGQLKRDLEGITNTMLTKSLRELEDDGLVNRIQYNEVPPHVEYSLSDMGKDLFPVFYAIMNWGFKYEEEIYDVKEDK
jgi:DNA-binding HxlR family transcriptional regulator